MLKSLFFLFAFVLCAFNLNAQQKTLSVNPLLEPFYHGVASGDPKTDRVILWTRVTPDSMSGNTIPVEWKIATDTGLVEIINSGTVMADIANDYTVKVDATGLQPNTYYYYEFSALNRNSLRGRTKTVPTGNIDSIRFAVVSCANYEAGYFNGYAAIKNRNDIDAIIHLGDYIYEYETGGYAPNNNISNRNWAPLNEAVDLADYRTRFSSYHLDEDLLRLHQQYPMIVIWDDHEVADNSYKGGAENHNPSKGEGIWQLRKAGAIKAFNEWIPIRQESGDQDTTIFRKFQYGDLLNLYMLDTRLHGRDKQNGYNDKDTNRTILGHDQYNWLTGELKASTTRWNIIGQQVMVAPLDILGIDINDDQWHGYPVERENLLDLVLKNNINDVVVLTGDIHTSWALDLKRNSQNVGVEFVTPSITSPGLDFLSSASELTLRLSNSHLEWVDLSEHGFTILDINKSQVTSEWYFVPTIDNKTDKAVHETSYFTKYGDRFISSGGAPIPPRKGLAGIFAPVNSRPFEIIDTIIVDPVDTTIVVPVDTTIVDPIDTTITDPVDTTIIDTSIVGISAVDKPVILGTYPNPFNETLILHFYIHNPSEVTIKMQDLSGKVIETMVLGSGPEGVHIRTLPFQKLAAGVYILSMHTKDYVVKRKVIKK